MYTNTFAVGWYSTKLRWALLSFSFAQVLSITLSCVLNNCIQSLSQVLNRNHLTVLSQVLSYTHSLFSSTQSCSIYWSTQLHSLSFLKDPIMLNLLKYSVTLTLFLKDSIMLSFFKFSVTLLSNALNHTHSLFSSNQSLSLFSITLILIQYSILYSVYLL